MKIYTDCPEVRQIVSIAFPSYSGRKFAVDIIAGNMRLDSAWSGGSRDYYALVDMVSGRSIPIPENGTPFSNGGQIFTLESLPANIALVQHMIFCGKDLGVTVFVGPDNLNRFALPAPAELTLNQKIVLAFTRERKSSYNGKNRQQMASGETGIIAAQWESAKAECIAAGWLGKSGAITDSGRNVIQSTRADALCVPGFNPYAVA